MDSDNKNGNSGGAIFSGNTENTDTSPSVISSAAADTKAAGMPHSFSARRPTKILTAPTGDIIVGGVQPKPKSHKKPFVIGLITLVFIIIATVAILLITRNSGNSGQSSIKSFNNYAGYLLTGATNDSFTISDYDISNGYFAQNLFNTNSTADKHAFFIELANRFEVFATENSDKLPQDLRESTQNILNYFVLSTEVTDPTVSELVNKYVTDGYTSTVEFVSQRFSVFTSSESSEVRKYGANKIQQFEALVNYINAYQNCIVDGSMDTACVAASPANTEVLDSMTQAESAAGTDVLARNESLQMLLSNCYEFNQLINGEKEP